VTVYKFGTSGNNPTKLYQATYHEAGVIKWVQILEGLPQQNSGGRKTSKILLDFDNIRIWSQISSEWIVTNIWKIL